MSILAHYHHQNGSNNNSRFEMRKLLEVIEMLLTLW